MNGYERMRIAAFIDGEGGRIEIQMQRNTFIIPYIVIRHREPAVTNKLLKYGGSEKPIGKGRNLTKQLWRSRGDEAVDILKEVRPLLWSPTKQELADLVINLRLSENGARLLEDNPHVITEMMRLMPAFRPSAADDSDPHDRVP